MLYDFKNWKFVNIVCEQSLIRVILEGLSNFVNFIWNIIDMQDEMIQKMDEPKIAGNYVDMKPIN